MASSSIPLRPRSLALLMRERYIAETMDVYRGNLLWSVLASLHGLAKRELTMPSYGKKYAELRGLKKAERKKEMTNDQVIDRVKDMFRTFRAKEVTKNEAV